MGRGWEGAWDEGEGVLEWGGSGGCKGVERGWG
jgi:hypothetical protein